MTTNKQGYLYTIESSSCPDDFTIFPSFNKRKQDVLSAWKNKNRDHISWADTAIITKITQVEAIDLTHIKALAERALKDTAIDDNTIPLEQTQATEASKITKIKLDIPNTIKESIQKDTNSAATYQGYLSIIRGFMRHHHDSQFIWDEDLLTDTETIIDYAMQKKSEKILDALIKGYKAVTDKKLQTMVDLRRKMSQERQVGIYYDVTAQTPPPEDQKYLKIRELRKKAEAIPDTELLNKMIAAINTYISPRRAGAWLNVVVSADVADEGNYLNLKTGEIIWREFKTARWKGVIRETLPDELIHIIRKYINSLRRRGLKVKWLLSGEDLQKFSSSKYSNLVYELLGHSCIELRHIWVTETLDACDDINELSKTMMTSTWVCLTTYDDKRRLFEKK